jgi:hypothetical protein
MVDVMRQHGRALLLDMPPGEQTHWAMALSMGFFAQRDKMLHFSRCS